MRLVPDIAWRSSTPLSAPIDARLLPLLRLIRTHGTLRAACGPAGMSYRSAWDLLAVQTQALGAPLAVLSRGRGARLAPLGEQLIAADDAARQELESARPRLTIDVDAHAKTASARLRMAASHDLLLAELCATMLDLRFRGSLECLAAYARGEVEVAGFHLSPGAPAEDASLGLLAPRRDRLIRFAARDQGLLLPAGNPRRVHGFADIAKRRLRFVNRQLGSGTRQLIDQMLRQSGLDPARLRGYAVEEFTHVAVAATVAAGRADAGVGVRAAAVRFGLTFLPLRTERYWLVTRARSLRDARVQRLIGLLESGSLERLARRLTGYDVRGAGEVVPLSALESVRPD